MSGFDTIEPAPAPTAPTSAEPKHNPTSDAHSLAIGRATSRLSSTSNGSVELAEKQRDVVPQKDFRIDPFVSQGEDGAEDFINFRTMGWFAAGLVSTAENLALGLLSFPSIFERLGMVGAIIATLSLGIMAYGTAWILVDLKVKYMGVMNFGDAGDLMFGKWGRRIFGWGLVLKAMGLAGSHTLAGEEALRSLSSNATCGVVWGVVVIVVSIIMSYSREWGKLSAMSFLSVFCVLTASLITIIATGVQPDSILVKNAVPIEWHAFPKNPSFPKIIGALCNIVFAYGGNMAVFTFCSEMRDPREFKKSFLMVQGLGTTAYIVVGATIYAFGGQYVTSPAFTMTTHTVTIIAYAFAFVTIMISGVLAVNVGAKYVYVSSLRNSPLLTSGGWRAHGIWIAIVSMHWVVGFIVSQLVPFFNQLLTIVSAIFTVWLTYGFVGIIWFWDRCPWFAGYVNDGELRKMDKLKWALGVCAVLSLIVSVAMTPLGLYSAAVGIRDGYANGVYKRPFAC